MTGISELAPASADREGTPVLTVVTEEERGRVEEFSAGATDGSMLDEIVRDGAAVGRLEARISRIAGARACYQHETSRLVSAQS